MYACMKQPKLATSRSQLYQRISKRSELFRKPRGLLLHLQTKETLGLSKNTLFSRSQNGAPRAPVELQVEPLPIRVMQEALEARSASPYTLHTETPPREPIALKIGTLALPTLT